jgi:tRNA pseudouridine38-40 synthase
VATDVSIADAEFSARFDAIGRRYRYRIVNRPVPDPFSARFAWWVPEPLRLPLMQLACDPLLGEHDFSSFCKRPKVAPGEEPVSLTRRVTEATWNDLGDGELVFEIAGSAFCHQMVRSIVGFHAAVGRGKRSAGEVRAVLAARDRQVAEQPAPPHGLTLVAVHY